MKKVVLFLIFTALLVGGVFLFQPFSPAERTPPAQFLPEDTLAYMYLRNPSTFFYDTAQTPLGQELQAIDFVKLALDLEVNLEKIAVLRDIREQLADQESRNLLSELFNKALTLAILPNEQQTDLGQYAATNLLVFAQPKQSTRLLRLKMGNLLDDSVTSSQYGKHFIYRFQTFLKTPLSVVIVGQLVILSLDERTLRRALDRFDEGGKSLEENFFFQEFKQKYGQNSFFSYVNLQKIQLQLRSLFPAWAETSPRKNSVVEMMQGLNAGTYWFDYKDGLRRDKITIHYNETQLKEDIDYFLDIKPARDIHFNSSPQDTLLYFWTNTFDLNALWDLLTQRANIEPKMVQSFEESVGLTAGVPYEEMLAMVGNHFHFILRPPAPDDPVPLPNFTIIFNLSDEEKAKKTMQQLFLLNAIPHNNDIYRDIPFTYWGHDMQNGLQPVYAFYNSSVYFSTSVQTQLEIVDTLRDRDGLTSTYEYNVVSKPLMDQNNAHGFIQIPALVDVVKELISIGEAMYSRQNRKEAYRTKKIIYSLIYPLLDGLKTYSSAGLRSYNEEGKLIIEARSAHNQRVTE